MLPYHSREMKLLAETDGKTRERAQTQEEEEGTTTAAAAGWARSWLGLALGLAGPFLFLFFFPFFIFTHTHTGAFIAQHDSCINIFSLSLILILILSLSTSIYSLVWSQTGPATRANERHGCEFPTVDTRPRPITRQTFTRVSNGRPVLPPPSIRPSIRAITSQTQQSDSQRRINRIPSRPAQSSKPPPSAHR